MCTNPLTIIKRAEDCYDSPYKFYKPSSNPFAGLRPYATFKAVVPCGKCAECLKRRQNDLAARCAREALKRGSMSFVTLTYDESSVPLSMRFRVVDKDTGEIFQDTLPMPLVRDSIEHCSSDFEKMARAQILCMDRGPLARYCVKNLDFPDDLTGNYLYQAVITPSLNRRDPRLWLKRCRVQYKREFGKDLPDFSYVLVGEYGPKTCRPHYHCAFFGLSKEIVQWFCSKWDYGFTNLKFVNAINPDGSPGFVIASKYIGKYVVKGRFECNSVKECISEKPRLCLSQGLGMELPRHIIDYYRAYDIYGKYDIDTMRFEATGKTISDNQLKVLIDEVHKRNSITIAGMRFCLPLNISKKIWYVKESNGKVHCSCFRRAYSAALSFDPVQHLFERLQNEGQSLEKIKDAVLDFIESDQASRIIQDSFDSQSLLREYYSSVF